jgi:serine/threonine protein kinase
MSHEHDLLERPDDGQKLSVPLFEAEAPAERQHLGRISQRLMPLSAGASLGPYKILAPIGAGGMGEVYRARDTRLGREVAIKVLPEAFARDADRLARFDREARAVSSLNHPHICVLHDIGNQDGIAFLVMEYIEGETLFSRLAKGPLPLEEALRYAIEIAGALALAHRQGIYHRDLKPGNIMLTRSGAKLSPTLKKRRNLDGLSTGGRAAPLTGRPAASSG